MLEERFADAKAVRMRYFVGGDGPPLILLHGLSGAASNWWELVDALKPRYRLLVPDLPGHGGSAPLPATPNLDAYADRVHLVAERERMLPAAVIGHSLGGVVALRLAVRRPKDVRALVLASSAGIASGTRSAEFWITAFGISRPGRLAARWRGAIRRHHALRWLVFGPVQVADPRSLSDRAVDCFLAGLALHTDVIGAGRALVRDDPRIDIARVRCPALVVWGARDRQVPVYDAFEYARRLRGPLRVVADAGHLVIAERPEACADAISSFLEPIGLRVTPRLGEA